VNQDEKLIMIPEKKKKRNSSNCQMQDLRKIQMIAIINSLKQDIPNKRIRG